MLVVLGIGTTIQKYWFIIYNQRQTKEPSARAAFPVPGNGVRFNRAQCPAWYDLISGSLSEVYFFFAAEINRMLHITMVLLKKYLLA